MPALAMAVKVEQPPVPVPELNLLTVRADASGALRVEGFCAIPGAARPTTAKVVRAQLRGAVVRVPGEVTPAPSSPLPNLMRSKSAYGLADAGFDIVFDVPDRERPGNYVVELGVEFEHVCVLANFSRRYERGSAGSLGAHAMGNGVYLQPGWSARSGLRVAIVLGRPSIVPGGVRSAAGRCSLEFEAPAGFLPVRARWSDLARGPALRVEPDPDDRQVAAVHLELSALGQKRSSRLKSGIELIDGSGATRLLHAPPECLPAPVHVPGTNLAIAADREGAVTILPADPGCTVDSVEIAEDGRELVVRGTYAGVAPLAVTLKGARVVATGDLAILEGNGFESRIPLHAAGWLGQDRPLPSGGYSIDAYDGVIERKLSVSRLLEQSLPMIEKRDAVHVRVERDRAGAILIEAAAPLGDREVGAPGLKTVTAPANRGPEIKEALYLESWFGKSFSDNPAPLADALRDDFPKVYVGVSDNSVEVPDHVIPVVMGTAEWWEAVTSSRVVVNNSWIPGYFKRRAGQKVIQTWHGTPLKKLGFDRSQHEGRASTPKSFAWGSSKWDLLVSPNAYSTEILRRAYTFDGQIAEIGYPRNDILTAGGGKRDQVRAALGIAADETVVLYAPTFREAERGRSAFCDVESLARDLGAGYRLVVRGHSATLRGGSDHRSANVLDVTSYPDSSHILAIADVLVTDYSSVMFDFTATRRPVVFFTPDMDRYSKDGRGVYFDLDSEAPGQVIRKERLLADAVRRAWASRGAESVRYDAWVTRFNAYDDGGATARLASIVREWL
ncbi:CDP-glycerol glycerophosphotransferase family protein [Demequina aurantiaca]|uniref:CDP-glycerol glycerophosphotransferase family protein n=1 Tax=Demequina aurantiaca TaxID=676200 RepID=UPI003D32A019